LVLSDTSSLGSTAVNQFTFSYMRDKNIQGLTLGGPGPSLASLGFAPPSQGGIFQLTTGAAQNWPELSFNNYTLGAFNSTVAQFNNTYQWQDDFTKIIGTHTLKFGADYHLDQVDINHPTNGANGVFGFSGLETGIDFADMLIGAPDCYFQGTPASLPYRGWYLGTYAEDSWRATPKLDLLWGVRWEETPYWSARHNINPTVLEGVQSKLFPTAPVGYVFPGDPGVPTNLANPRYDNFGPRLGVAYAPSFSSGPLHWLLGDTGKSSVRAGYGLYYTNIRSATIFNLASPPYAFFYGSSAPPLFTQPFITRASGQNLGQRFPIPLPPNNLSPSNPDTNVNWAQFLPISGLRDPLPNSKSPYSQHVEFSIQRQFTSNTLLTLAFAGSYGRHLVVMVNNNPGNPALCLSLSKASEVMPGTPTCGPFGENGVYYPVGGGVVNSTRNPFGPNYATNDYLLDRGISSYNSLQTTLRHTSGRAQFLLSYTYSKAIDEGSGFGDEVLPTNYSL
ncbi:MAG: TonB-dependent receptor, partial [Terriglobia bacterium]